MNIYIYIYIYILEVLASVHKTLECFPLTLSSDSKLPTAQTQCLPSIPHTLKHHFHVRPLCVLREVFCPSLVAQTVKNPHAVQVPGFNILVRKIPWSRTLHVSLQSGLHATIFSSIWCLWPPYITHPPHSFSHLSCVPLPRSYLSLRNDLYIHSFILILLIFLPWCFGI